MTALCCLLAACEGDDPVVDAAPDAGAVRVTVAKLGGLSGSVTLERDGARRPAAEESLFTHDAVETGPAGRAEVHFDDGRVVELGPDARLVIGEDATGLLLEVQKGIVLSRVPRELGDAAVAIRILTPFGLTRVGGGESEVSIAVGKDDARIEVLIGQVELVTREGEEPARAGAGETLSLSTGKVEILGREGDGMLMLEPIQVTILADGRTELRKKGSKAWRRVGKNGAVVESGDAVRVRKGSSSLDLQGTRSKVKLTRGTQLVFDQSGRGEGVEAASVALERGGLELDLARGKKTRLSLGGLELESERGGYFSVVKTRSGYDVSALAGDLIVKRGKLTKRIAAGEQARIGPGDDLDVQTQKRSTPELTLPTRFGQRVFHPGLDEATLDWRGEDRDYFVRVAQDPGFEGLVLEGLVHQSEVAVQIPRRGSLYWEIRESAGGKELDSGSAHFAPEPRLRDLERLRNEVPEGPEKTTIYYQDKPPAVTFTYAAEPSAASYRVAVFRQGELSRPVSERTVSQTSAALEAGALAEGSYLWSVTPLSQSGQPIRGGRMNKLDLVYDNSVPTLLIRAPRNGERAAGELRTHGVAPVGARLYIEGRPVELDDKNRFDTRAKTSGGLIVYRLVRPNTADSYYVRKLRRGGR